MKHIRGGTLIPSIYIEVNTHGINEPLYDICVPLLQQRQLFKNYPTCETNMDVQRNMNLTGSWTKFPSKGGYTFKIVKLLQTSSWGAQHEAAFPLYVEEVISGGLGNWISCYHEAFLQRFSEQTHLRESLRVDSEFSGLLYPTRGHIASKKQKKIHLKGSKLQYPASLLLHCTNLWKRNKNKI